MPIAIFGPAIVTDPPLTRFEQRLVRLAKDAIRDEVLGKRSPRINRTDPVHPVFVTVERNGTILGCRGDLTTQTASLESEVVREAQNAAAFDPRYHPITPGDLKSFRVTITIVKTVTPVDSVDSLRPSEGLILESGDRTGVVLPWEGKDPHLRLQWAYEKAGVPVGSSASLFILRGVRFRG